MRGTLPAERESDPTLHCVGASRCLSYETAVAEQGLIARQGQYLVFIHAYTLVNDRPPVEADMQRFFQVSEPVVYQMVLALDRGRLISRKPKCRAASSYSSPRRSLPSYALPDGIAIMGALSAAVVPNLAQSG